MFYAAYYIELIAASHLLRINIDLLPVPYYIPGISIVCSNDPTPFISADSIHLSSKVSVCVLHINSGWMNLLYLLTKRAGIPRVLFRSCATCVGTCGRGTLYLVCLSAVSLGPPTASSIQFQTQTDQSYTIPRTTPFLLPWPVFHLVHQQQTDKQQRSCCMMTHSLRLWVWTESSISNSFTRIRGFHRFSTRLSHGYCPAEVPPFVEVVDICTYFVCVVTPTYSWATVCSLFVVSCLVASNHCRWGCKARALYSLSLLCISITVGGRFVGSSVPILYIPKLACPTR